MSDENKNEQYGINEDNINLESPSKQNKFNSKRKRKALINNDSENEENGNINDNNNLKETDKEEEKENENNEETNNRKTKYENNNKFKTLERGVVTSPPKDNLVLQEKLKKIFMNRDKAKYQYIKQDIPDSLKYNSDDSDSSEFSQLRKSKNKKNIQNFAEKDKNEINNNKIENENENEKNISNTANNNTNTNINININNNNDDLQKKEEENILAEIQNEKEIKNEIKDEIKNEIKDEIKDVIKIEKEKESNINIEKKEEKIKYFNKNQKNEDKDKKKFNTYNINLSNNKFKKEENQEKDNENKKEKETLNDNKNKYIRGYFKYNETNENDKDENNDKNKKEITKKSILLKVLEKRDKKDSNVKNNDDTKTNNKNQEDNNNKNIRNNADSQEKKQKLLKLLIEKKNNTIDKDNINENENENIKKEEKKENGDEDEDEDKDKTLEMKYDEENEDRRRRLMNQIKSDSNNSTLIKTHGRFDKKEKEKDYQQENKEQEEKENIDNRDVSDKDKDKDKGTYIPKNHKNKLTINLRPKDKFSKRESASNIKPKEFYNDYDEVKQKNSPKDLLSIIGKLKEKKSAESKIQNSPKSPYMEIEPDHDETNKEEINESEIEKFEKNVKKTENEFGRKKDTQYAEKENINNNIYKGRRISAKNIRGNTLNSEELKRRKKLEEDLRAEIMKKDSVNDINDIKEDDTSTINNTTKSNIQTSQYENDEKSNVNQFTYQGIPTRNTSNMGIRYKNEDENAFPTEIVVNDVPSSNLDRSFDAVNTYMKRKVKGKNSMSIYKPKKVANNIRNRSQEKPLNEMLENSPSSMIPNQNMVYNHSKHILNSPCYIRNKNSFNSKNCLTKNNHSFCELLPEENNNITKGKNNINMEIDLGGGLNSSFDAYNAYNAMRYNNKTSKNTSNINEKVEPIYGTGSKKFTGYSKKTNIPVRNMNYNKNTNVNSFYKNENVNKSYGYLNTGFNNNIFDDNNINPNLGTKNINYFYGMNQPQFVTYNNNSHNQIINQNYYNNNPLKTYANQLSPSITHDAFDNNFIQNTPVLKRNISTKNNNINYIYNNNNTYINNTNYNNNFTYNNNNNNNNNIINNNVVNNNFTNNTAILNHNEKNTSINVEDLLILEEKFIQIIMSLNKNGTMHNECFEFWNYYYNCSLYGFLEKLFKSQDILNVKISMNHILMSVMICYDYSFELDLFKGDYSNIEDIIKYNHKNLIIIYEHILSKVSAESKSNVWVFKLQELINNYNKLNSDDDYVVNKKNREISPINKIIYNMTVIVQNIRVLLKNYKTQKTELLTSIFKKINDKSYEEINTFFRDNILRCDNVNGSVLASVFLKDNEYFQTEPAPYIKTKNTKPYSLVLDLDETLVHFKMNSDEENEGLLQIRPGVVPFLEKVGQYYELIVFTAATQEYGDLLIDAIEENNLYFEHRFYRQHTVIKENDFIKDLSRIGRPLDKIIIVDNMPQNFKLQKENGINIKAFWGEDANDNALEELGIILVNIAQEGGDVRIGLEKYKDDILRKVTSNISKSNY